MTTQLRENVQLNAESVEAIRATWSRTMEKESQDGTSMRDIVAFPNSYVIALSLLKQALSYFVIITRLDTEPNYLLTNRA